MRKSTAIEYLGGTEAAAARTLRVTPGAVNKWPDPLPRRVADRVRGALFQRLCTGPGASVVHTLMGGHIKPDLLS